MFVCICLNTSSYVPSTYTELTNPTATSHNQFIWPVLFDLCWSADFFMCWGSFVIPMWLGPLDVVLAATFTIGVFLLVCYVNCAVWFMLHVHTLWHGVHRLLQPVSFSYAVKCLLIYCESPWTFLTGRDMALYKPAFILLELWCG